MRLTVDKTTATQACVFCTKSGVYMSNTEMAVQPTCGVHIHTWSPSVLFHWCYRRCSRENCDTRSGLDVPNSPKRVATSRWGVSIGSGRPSRSWLRLSRRRQGCLDVPFLPVRTRLRFRIDERAPFLGGYLHRSTATSVAKM
jgi:hypothetical protein